MYKKIISCLMAAVVVFSVLSSCGSEPAGDAPKNDQGGVAVTTYGPDDFRRKTAEAEKWTEENFSGEETETDKRYGCDVLTEDGAAYLLSVSLTSNGMADVYTDLLEKHMNGTVTVLFSINEVLSECPIQLVRDGDRVLLMVLGGEQISTWGDSGKVMISYQNGNTEIVEYSFSDEETTDEMKAGREYRGFRCKFLHMLGRDDIAGMTFVSAPAPVRYGGVTTRLFELNENLIPVSATVINSDGKYEETYRYPASEDIGTTDGGDQSAENDGQHQFTYAFSTELRQGMLSDFDIAFLKAENEKTNKVYSPLSIKYALKMLEEGTAGSSRKQISDILGDYEPHLYASGSNMSFANGMFVRYQFGDSIKSGYKDILRNRYGAEISLLWSDDPDGVNDWVMRRTLGMIPEIIEEIRPEQDFFLINALAINMDWKIRFFDMVKKISNGYEHTVDYLHENYGVYCAPNAVVRREFDNGTKKTNVSGMEFFASMDNYDIVNILGEENIRKTVGDAYREWIGKQTQGWYYDGSRYIVLTDPDTIEEVIASYLDRYITHLKGNYQELGEKASIDFMMYADDDVRAFAKDLEEYDGVQLQYVGIMPVNEDLDTFIENADSGRIRDIIDSLKDLKRSNFKDGVITRIRGFVPKFDFDYELQLTDDLRKIGITDIFDSTKADLSGMTDQGGEYINTALHKAKIEFTQDGIKAAAATLMGGDGADMGGFDYIYDVPVEEIDLTFDRPFMFIIRDRATGEVWFTGTVYDPLKWSEDRTREEYYSFG